VLAIVVSLAVALATVGPVDDALDEARARAGAGDVDGAIEIVRQARAQHDDRDLLFVEAQLHRIKGDCEEAVPLFEAFQATNPPEEDRAEVDRHLAECRETLGIETPPAPADAVEPQPSPPPPVLTEPPDKPTPESGAPAPAAQGPDRIGLALWITGGVLAAGGLATYGASWGLRSSANDGNPTLDTYLDREQRARTVSGIGIATASVGAAILVGAAVRHIVRGR